MNEEVKKSMEQMFEAVEEALEKAKLVCDLQDKVNALLEPYDFPVKMSVINMVLAKAIVAESDTLGEAMHYVARTTHSLVDILDRQPMEDDEEDDEDAGTLQ